MHAKLQSRWYALPLFSALLMVLSFHPFNIWPLGFVALAPLYYFTAHVAHSRARAWWGGVITGGLFSFFLSYFTIIQFHWLPEAYLFTSLVRMAVVPIVLIGGSVCGLAMLSFKALRSRSLLLTVAVGAAVYAASEFFLQVVFAGYYLAELSFTAVSVPFLMWFAPIGGSLLVSLLMAGVSVAVAEIALRGSLLAGIPLALIAIALLSGGGAYASYLAKAPILGAISVSVLQQGVRTEGQFGSKTENSFTFPWLTEALDRTPSSQLVIYPFSPVEGALYRKEAPLNKNVLVASESEFGTLIRAHLSAKSTLLTWNTLYDGAFHNEYQLWRDGKVVGEYQKRAPFPFMDYTPQWAQRIGLYSTPFDVVPGQGNTLEVEGVALGALLCSEVHSQSLARVDARRAPLLIAAGSEAMFQDPVASAFSLKAAQFRAAENHVTVIRGNILGPSAIIGPTGALRAYAPSGKETLLHDTVPLVEPRETLFNRFGQWLTLGLIFGILGAALWRRHSR